MYFNFIQFNLNLLEPTNSPQSSSAPPVVSNYQLTAQSRNFICHLEIVNDHLKRWQKKCQSDNFAVPRKDVCCIVMLQHNTRLVVTFTALHQKVTHILRSLVQWNVTRTQCSNKRDDNICKSFDLKSFPIFRKGNAYFSKIGLFLKVSFKSKWAVTTPGGFESKCILAINRFCQFTSGVETKEGFILFQTLKIFMAQAPSPFRKIAITAFRSHIASDLIHFPSNLIRAKSKSWIFANVSETAQVMNAEGRQDQFKFRILGEVNCLTQMCVWC